jgi:hypothetical protein
VTFSVTVASRLSAPGHALGAMEARTGGSVRGDLIALGALCVARVRGAAERAADARRAGRGDEAAAAHEAGRQALDEMALVLLGAARDDGRTDVLSAQAATCSAEFARLEGREDAALWRIAALRWEQLRSGAPDVVVRGDQERQTTPARGSGA